MVSIPVLADKYTLSFYPASSTQVYKKPSLKDSLPTLPPPMSASTPTFAKDRVRLIFFLKRKEGLTKEQFSRHWLDPHAKLFMSLESVKANVTKYEQLHTNDVYTEAIKAIQGSIPTSDWDGIVHLEGESYEKLFAVFQSEEYAKIVTPDEEKFIDRAKCQILPLDLASLI
ncbi:hypothetical protein Hypma_008455 [Hypsizygus marmoreus]|uniref:EthD domain-containing protein n=1 Tax=Hypsizygus marmoreus TaxID=39966 RepID=A0A369JRG5_HYPMA|nr:hypothetical protein Hypma_008455 [Hypsizygus marmoreus]